MAGTGTVCHDERHMVSRTSEGISVRGSAAVLPALLGALAPGNPAFNIVTP